MSPCSIKIKSTTMKDSSTLEEDRTMSGPPAAMTDPEDGHATINTSFSDPELGLKSIQKDSKEISQFVDILIHSQSIRRLGSAALNLCYVAQGRLDAYWAGFLKVWDVAAGALIATEAGAILSRHDGKPHDPWGGELVVAGSKQLHSELSGRLQAAEPCSY